MEHGAKVGEAPLRLSPEELSLVLESLTEYAIFTFDERGRITMWTGGAERVFGYSHGEMLGRSTEILLTPDDRARGAHLQEMREAALSGRAAGTRDHVRKDGARFSGSGIVFPVRGPADNVSGYVKVCRDLTERQQWKQRLAEAQDMEQRARAVLSRLIAVQEEERRRIARDLHDHLGQQVTALHLHLEALNKDLQAENHPAQARLDAIHAMFKRLDKDFDFFTWELRPGALYNLGLVAALTDLTTALAQNYDLPVTFECLGLTDGELSGEVEVNLYRIAQAALDNAMKHAKASRADVLLQKADGRVVLTISDDGTGFALEDAPNRYALNRGLGLSGMKERAALLGGTLEVESKPDEGTSVIATIPMGTSGLR